MKNLITDISGVRVGHADDAALASGVTAIIFDFPAVAAIDVRGGGPGTREDGLLKPESTVQEIDAIALSGGSAFGLDAAGGVQAWLAEQGRGLRVRDAVIPIVPGAICFDLLNGGDKAWGRFPPYRDLGYARGAAASDDFAFGSVGAGLGATTANLKGGLGSASAQTEAASPSQRSRWSTRSAASRSATGRGSGRRRSNRTANSADADCRRRSRRTCCAQGQGRAGRDGGGEHHAGRRRHRRRADQAAGQAAGDDRADRIGARHLSRARPARWRRGVRRRDRRKADRSVVGLTELGMVAANTVARAIARGVYGATALPFLGALPAWSDRFG